MKATIFRCSSISDGGASATTVNAAIDQLGKLRGCEAHSSVILSHVDSDLFKKLGVNVTFEPKYQAKKLYHK